MSESGWFLAGALVMLLLVLLAIFLVRIRALAGRVGAFECARKKPGAGTWTSGIARFGDNELAWYRLVSLSPWPHSSWNRADLELGQARPRGRGHSIVEVPCRYQGQEFELAMVEDSHSALVAWMESAAPTQPHLF